MLFLKYRRAANIPEVKEVEIKLHEREVVEKLTWDIRVKDGIQTSDSVSKQWLLVIVYLKKILQIYILSLFLNYCNAIIR